MRAVHSDATRAIVELQGEMDLTNADLLTAVLDNQLALGRRFVRLDVSGLAFLDSVGLHALVQAHNEFLAARGTLVLTGVGPRIARLLRATASMRRCSSRTGRTSHAALGAGNT